MHNLMLENPKISHTNWAHISHLNRFTKLGTMFSVFLRDNILRNQTGANGKLKEERERSELTRISGNAQASEGRRALGRRRKEGGAPQGGACHGGKSYAGCHRSPFAQRAHIDRRHVDRPSCTPRHLSLKLTLLSSLLKY